MPYVPTVTAGSVVLYKGHTYKVREIAQWADGRLFAVVRAHGSKKLSWIPFKDLEQVYTAEQAPATCAGCQEAK